MRNESAFVCQVISFLFEIIGLAVNGVTTPGEAVLLEEGHSEVASSRRRVGIEHDGQSFFMSLASSHEVEAEGVVVAGIGIVGQ